MTSRPRTYRAADEGTVAALPRPAKRIEADPPERPRPIEIEVHGDVAAIFDEWKSFETCAFSTLYQSALWCRTWMETVAAGDGTRAVVIAGREAGLLRFILPFQVRSRHGIRVLEWLGAPRHGYGYPVIDPQFMPRASQWFEDNFARVVEAAGKIDTVSLSENPTALFGWPHPFTALFNMKGANLSFALALERDFEALHGRRRSAERRRTSRKAENGLRQMGEVQFGLPASKAERHALIATMFRQQEQRLAERGVHKLFGPAERAFVHRLVDAEDDASPVLAPYHLSLDGEVQAVMLGGIHNGSYWALISSLASGPVRKHSPGEVALRYTIRACCERGLSRFDFSSGDADYKRQWAEETIGLSTVLAACTLKGLAWAAATGLAMTAKGLVKRTPWLRDPALWLRRAFRGTRLRP